MKKYIITLGLISGLSLSYLGLANSLFDNYSEYKHNGLYRLESIENTNINPPQISFSSDTLDGGGNIQIYIAVENPDKNFSNGYLYLRKPDGNMAGVFYFYNDNENNHGLYTVSYKVSSFDIPGYWYIDAVELYYSGNRLTFTSADLNAGFYVINTEIDTTPPIIKCLDVSRDTAGPGDTVCITVIAEDNVSGLSFLRLQVLDTTDNKNILYMTYYSNTEGRKIDTLLFYYHIGEYENTGHRKIEITVYDYAGNYYTYLNEALAFDLVITGTTEDNQQPVVKDIDLVNNSQNGEIILKIIASDDISGISSMNINLRNSNMPDEVFTFSYYNPTIVENDFIKINDSLYRCNLLENNPYMASGNYSLQITLNDYADNFVHKVIDKLFYIENVNSDDYAPEIEYVKFNKDTVIAGNSVTLTIKLTDDKSGIKNFRGFLRNDKTWNFFHFDIDFNEPGVTDYVFTKTYCLSEFGPGGLWYLSSLSVTDHSEKEVYDYSKSWPGFYYYPKYLDTIPPVFESISFEPTVIHAGETVKVTLVASDNLSGIKDIWYFYDFINLYSIYNYDALKWSKVAPDTFQQQITVNEYNKNDSVFYQLYGISDAADNELDLDKEGFAFRIIPGAEIDTLPPVFDSLFVSDTIVNPDDTLTLVFYLHVDKSGIDSSLLYAYFTCQKQDELPYNYSNLPHIMVLPEYVDENQYIEKLPGHALKQGNYFFTGIGMSDKAGNYLEPQDAWDSYFSGNYSFQIVGDDTEDNEDPSLENIKLYPNVVQPGDTVKIEITVIEKGSGILGLLGIIHNSSCIEKDILLFSDWNITGIKDTFICQSVYIVPKEAHNGKWILSEIEILDYYENFDYYEYGSDFTDADFQVVGGHAYPNRPPTWIIPQINLTVEAGGLLNYKIPDYIVNDIDGDTLSFSAIMNSGDPLQPWMSFSNEDLSLTFCPDSESKGIYEMHIIASDPKGLSDSIPVNLTVINQGLTNMPSLSGPSIHIYPNPTTDFINIECPCLIKSATLYDLTGKVVHQTNSNFNRIITSDITKGIYIIILETEHGTFIDKILIR